MFSFRNKKDIGIFQMKKAPYLLLCSNEHNNIGFGGEIRKMLVLFQLKKNALSGAIILAKLSENPAACF